MTLKDYLATTSGLCILSSSDSEGRVATAVYSAPRIMDDGTAAFLMRERLTYRNTRENPHAACMFIEHGGGYRGIRLFLRKIREEDDPVLIAAMTRRHLSPEEDKEKGPKHLVVFAVERILPLVGTNDAGVTIG